MSALAQCLSDSPHMAVQAATKSVLFARLSTYTLRYGRACNQAYGPDSKRRDANHLHSRFAVKEPSIKTADTLFRRFMLEQSSKAHSLKSWIYTW